MKGNLLCINRTYCENGQVFRFRVPERCSTPLESPCSTSTCVEPPLVFSSSPPCPMTSVECSRDISKLGHLSVQDKKIIRLGNWYLTKFWRCSINNGGRGELMKLKFVKFDCNLFGE